MDEAPVKRVPVTLVTGFLGSGPRRRILRRGLRSVPKCRCRPAYSVHACLRLPCVQAIATHHFAHLAPAPPRAIHAAVAGKTTMLNHLLTKSAEHRKGRKLAVLVNEFGQVRTECARALGANSHRSKAE